MKYELLESIGTGGMATVHRARLRGVAGFERIVALKRIRPELATTPEYVERFIHEARIGAVFAHPNVVQVIELGKDEQSHFIAMEHLEGWSLLEIAAAAYYANVKIPLNVIVSLLHDLCGALEHIHSHRILHRDISLGNLFVTRTGHLKMIDFGIATRFGEGDDTNEIAGKPSYMSPEAIRGQGCDARSDLFSAGIVAWELLTSQKLFDGDTDRDTMRAVLFRSVVAPSAHRPDCPLVLDAIIKDLLAKNAKHRTRSATDVREQLFALEIDAQPADVARWVRSLFDVPVLDVQPELSTVASPVMLAPPQRRPFPWIRAMAAAAISLMAAVVVAPAAPPPVTEGERIKMEATAPTATLEVIETEPELDAQLAEPPQRAARVKVRTKPVVAAPPSRTTPSPRDVEIAQPARVVPPARVAPSTPAIVAPPARVAPPTPTIVAPPARVAPSTPAIVAPPARVAPPTPAVVVPPARVAPPTPAIDLPAAPRPAAAMIAPDRVKLLAGTISRVNLARFAPGVRRRFTAVLCIDAAGAVTSSKLPSDLPAWLRADLARDLAGFRFTPHDGGPACFARFMRID